MIFETDLDYDKLYSFTEDELFQYIEDNFVSPNITYAEGFSYKKGVSLMKIVCEKMLKINPSPEQWVFLLADSERLLCEACAGAGKTTMAQLRAIKDKLIHNVAGQNILALAYNTHAVEDMKLRHDYIIRSINNLKINELHRDPNICCYTFHSFCKSWMEDYLADFGIMNKNNYLLSESETHTAMQMAISALKKKQNLNVFTTDVTVDALLSLYAYTRETLTETNVGAWNMCPSIQDLSMFTKEQVLAIFEFYDKYKSIKHKLDFTDLIDNMYELCKRMDVMTRIRANYRYFIIDEYQDMTPAMLRIVRLILEGDPELGIPPYNESRLTCIGDGDQSIYGFRGTDPDNCVRFKEMFCLPGHMVKVTAMSENRRCPSEIIAYAKAVIESNTLRITKPIKAIKDGGKVDVYKYASCGDEMDKMISKLKTIPVEQLKNTCICYRNQSSSYMVGLALAEAGIPFKMVRGHLPLTDRLSCSIFDVLNMLSYPDIPDYVERGLYKVIPKSSQFTKNTISDLLKAEETRGRQTGERRVFTQIDYPACAKNIGGFSDAMSFLDSARLLHRNNKPMSMYLPGLIKLIRKYYLDWQLSKGGIITDEYISYITTWFSRDIGYDDFMQEYRKLLNEVEENGKKGVYCTTFHGLKGLEFDNVFIIDLSDSIFPGTELNQSKELSVQQKDILECEARRLFYVALTRTRKNLSIFFDTNTPSRYIRFFTPNTGLAETYKNYMHEDQGFLVTNVSDNEDDLDSLLADGSDTDLDSILQESQMESKQEISASVESQPTDIFRRLLNKTQEQDTRLRDKLGEDKFSMLEGKNMIKSVIDRVLTEGSQT